MKPEIENLKVWMSGKSTTGYQRALAMREFEQLLTYVAELEQLRQPPVSGQLLLKKLETKLNTSGSYSIPYHEDSIMTYGKICDHDDGYWCEHRREWILEFFKSNFR